MSFVSAARQQAKLTVLRYPGLLPWFEYRNRLRKTVRPMLIRRREENEAASAFAALPDRPAARVVTVIPTYRRPALLARAVASALQQSVTDHHVVVVDDGGGDVDLDPHPRLTVVRLGRNIGVAGAVRNVGIRVTRSEVLAFLDDDNEWMQDHLERCLELVDRGVFLVYGGLVRFDDEGRELDMHDEPFDRRLLRSRSYIDTSAIVVRRAPDVFFSRLPRSRLDFPVEDWELVWRLSRRHRVALSPEPTVRYTVHEGSYFSSWFDDPDSPLLRRRARHTDQTPDVIERAKSLTSPPITRP